MRARHPREREAFADGLIAGAGLMILLVLAFGAVGDLAASVAEALLR